ncbi:MAG: helix-turn-helix domain-containing protein [bacterium]|nr:helix-turn-helix domain-containing protein [bacterium]
MQREAAAEIGVSAQTLQYWEVGRHEPDFRHLPSIIRFLGYDPTPEARTMGQRVRFTRRALGLSQKELARDLGIDPSIVRDIEAEHLPGPRIRKLIDSFLDEHA